MTPPLHVRLRQLATLNPSRADEILTAANALEAAINTANAADSTTDDLKRMLGCWARARRIWCDVTGDDLV